MERPNEVIKILQEHDGELRTTKDGDDLVAWILDREAKLAKAEKLITQIEAVWSGMETVKRIIAQYRQQEKA